MMSETKEKQLERIQKKAEAIATRRLRTTTTTTLLKKTNLTTIKKRTFKLTDKFVTKSIITNPGMRDQTKQYK